MSLLSVHQHRMFPFEFLDHLTQHFNRVVKSEVFRLSRNKLEIIFKRDVRDDKTAVISLFTKLVTAFKSISDKYLPENDLHTQLRMNMNENEEYYSIQIKGVVFTPPGKFLNLFSLILWYHIRYITGTKPANTEIGTQLNEKWKKEEKHLRFEISQSRRRMTIEREEGPCYICGDPSYKLIVWEFKPYPNFNGIEMKTRVCSKHTTKLI